MNELEKIKRIIQRVESRMRLMKCCLRVRCATTGQNAMNQAKQFKETTMFTGLVLTKKIRWNCQGGDRFSDFAMIAFTG